MYGRMPGTVNDFGVHYTPGIVSAAIYIEIQREGETAIDRELDIDGEFGRETLTGRETDRF